jgi:hypothetical protein
MSVNKNPPLSSVAVDTVDTLSDGNGEHHHLEKMICDREKGADHKSSRLQQTWH